MMIRSAPDRVYDDQICSSLCTVSSALSPALLYKVNELTAGLVNFPSINTTRSAIILILLSAIHTNFTLFLEVIL